MNLKSLDNNSLHQNTIQLAKEERELTTKVLHHLREIERRSLFAEIGYSSLFEYCVQELKYSEGSAQRRISSMRLLRDVPPAELPELEKKIETGTLSLMTLSQAQVFFKQENIKSIEEKKEILLSLENKSKREVEKDLLERASVPFVKSKLESLVEELKGLLLHSKPGASQEEVLIYALENTINKLKQKAPKETKSLPPPVAVKKPTVKNTRYIPAETKRQVWARDKGQCTYTNKETNRKCTCKHALEFDHIQPFAMGGTNSTENLRLRCRTHNQLAAIQVYGQMKMANFMQRIS